MYGLVPVTAANVFLITYGISASTSTFSINPPSFSVMPNPFTFRSAWTLLSPQANSIPPGAA